MSEAHLNDALRADALRSPVADLHELTEKLARVALRTVDQITEAEELLFVYHKIAHAMRRCTSQRCGYTAYLERWR